MTTINNINFEDIINNIDNIADQTKKNYISSLKRVQNLIGNTPFRNARTMVNKINKQIDNPNVKSVIYSAILRILDNKKKQKTKYYSIFKEEKDIQQKAFMDKPKEKPKELEGVSLKDLQKTYKQFVKEKQYKLTRAEMILGFYILQAPRRLDFSDMEVIGLDDDIEKGKNYLFKDKKKYFFIFTEYKTKKNYGIQKLEITDKTLIKILNNKDLEIGDFFFKGSKRTLQNDIKSATNTIFRKQLNVQQLRILWSSEKFKGITEELIKDAFNSAHSVNMKLSNYVR